MQEPKVSIAFGLPSERKQVPRFVGTVSRLKESVEVLEVSRVLGKQVAGRSIRRPVSYSLQKNARAPGRRPGDRRFKIDSSRRPFPLANEYVRHLCLLQQKAVIGV